jgi:hypothetical protein
VRGLRGLEIGEFSRDQPRILETPKRQQQKNKETLK